MSGGGDIAASAFSQAGQNFANIAYSEFTHKRSRAEALEDYERQLADNRENWEAANAYNSPEQQMERLRQAGLNPNLVYGKGADHTAQSITSTPKNNYNRVVPKLEGGANTLLQAAQIGNIKANTDNLYQQNGLLQQEALLKAANITGVGIMNDKNKFDLEQMKAMSKDLIFKASQEASKSQFEKETAEFTNAEKYRQYLLNNETYSEALEALKAKYSSEVSDSKIKQNIQELQRYEIELNRNNIQKNDPLWMRLMVAKAKKLGLDEYLDEAEKSTTKIIKP